MTETERSVVGSNLALNDFVRIGEVGPMDRAITTSNLRLLYIRTFSVVFAIEYGESLKMRQRAFDAELRVVAGIPKKGSNLIFSIPDKPHSSSPLIANIRLAAEIGTDFPRAPDLAGREWCVVN